jgi:hypothetical protein
LGDPKRQIEIALPDNGTDENKLSGTRPLNLF